MFINSFLPGEQQLDPEEGGDGEEHQAEEGEGGGGGGEG
jgi:hypothetical protein